jgi:two-component system nitrate/nitrite response regulator NarL
MAFNPQLGPRDHGEPTGPARVFVLADDTLAADGLRAALANEAGLLCVAQIEEAEVLLWDLGSSPSRAVGAGAEVWRSARSRKQVIVALVPDEHGAAHALQQGALAVLQRRSHGPTLTAAILAVRHGLCVLDVSIADHYLQLTAAPAADDELDALTAREREVLDLLALGLSNKSIAERLAVSVHTIKFHVNSILAKLNADSRTAAVATALRRGLVTT